MGRILAFLSHLHPLLPPVFGPSRPLRAGAPLHGTCLARGARARRGLAFMDAFGSRRRLLALPPILWAGPGWALARVWAGSRYRSLSSGLPALWGRGGHFAVHAWRIAPALLGLAVRDACGPVVCCWLSRPSLGRAWLGHGMCLGKGCASGAWGGSARLNPPLPLAVSCGPARDSACRAQQSATHGFFFLRRPRPFSRMVPPVSASRSK